MYEYKERWQEAIDEAERLGLPVPDPAPHPAEMTIDVQRGEVIFNGPRDAHERGEWERRLSSRDSFAAEAKDLRARARRSPKHRAFYEEDAAHSERMARLISSVFPDVKTRRRPGFDLVEWREQQERRYGALVD